MKIKLGEICHKETSGYAQKDLVNLNGEYPIYGASGYIKCIDSYHQENPYVAVIKDGAGVGRTMYLPGKSSVIGTLQYLIPEENIDPHYLYYLIRAKHLEKYYMGAAIPHIYFKDYKNENIPDYDLKKQLKIVSRLSRIEKIIRYKNQQMEQLDNLIKARFVEMFGDPVIDNYSWGQQLFINYLESIRYGASTPPLFSNSGSLFIRATNIKKGRIIEENMKYISEEEASKLEKCKLKGGELLVVRSGVNAGDTCVVGNKYAGEYAGYDLILVPNNESNSIFLNELINTHYMEKIVKPLTRRAAQPHLNSDQVANLPIIKVPLNLQNQFASFVEKVDKSKVAVQKSLDETQLLFDSLMQKYFG